MSRLFDGDLDYIKVDDDARLESSSSISISCWYYPTGDPGTNGGRIISKNDGTDNDAYALTHILSNDQLQFRIRTTTGTANISVNDIFTTYDQWYHLMGLWATWGTAMRLYVDGTQVGSSLTRTGALLNTTDPFSIGGHAGSDTRRVQGRIAEVGIWNFRISSSGPPGVMRRVRNYPQNNVLYMPLWGKSATEMEYTFGGSYTVTHVSGPTVADHAPCGPKFTCDIWPSLPAAVAPAGAIAGIAVFNWTALSPRAFEAKVAESTWTALNASPFAAGLPTSTWTALQPRAFDAGIPTSVWTALQPQGIHRVGQALSKWIALNAVPFAAGQASSTWTGLKARAFDAGLPSSTWTALNAKWKIRTAIPTSVWTAFNAITTLAADIDVIPDSTWTALNVAPHGKPGIASSNWNALNATPRARAELPASRWTALNATPRARATIALSLWSSLEATAAPESLQKIIEETEMEFSVTQESEMDFSVTQETEAEI